MIQDTTSQGVSMFAGIPATELRIIVLVGMTFLLLIAIVLMFVKMKELDAGGK